MRLDRICGAGLGEDAPMQRSAGGSAHAGNEKISAR
jgi:hypothetical protein